MSYGPSQPEYARGGDEIPDPDLDGTNHAGRRGSTLGLGTCRGGGRENDYRDAEAIGHRT